ncbi:MAG: amino acid ABC transporter permease [Clostridia bacterium]|nr:amino acid ABC transporter permease [Clostridia bacterium]
MWPLLLDGLKVTVAISLISIALGLVIGFLSCLMGLSRVAPLRWISKGYIWLIRGTPMIVQAYFVFFAIPALVSMFASGFKFSSFSAGVITLSLNAGAYLSEIFRSGIQAVPVGQTEAARSLGLTPTKTMLRVVLPQAFKITVPSIVNQFIISVKDTSILSVISLPELVNITKQYTGASYKLFEPYSFVALFYLVIISVLMVLSKYIEKRMNYGAQKRN